MAFTSVNHDGVAEPGLEMKNDWGLCVVGNYDLIEVSGGGTWRMIRGCLLFLCMQPI